MITSVIDICNMALDYCNVRNITSLDEDTKQSKKCSMWYDTVRKSLLLNINASFSIKRAILAEVADYTPVYGYQKAYSLPSDCLQVLNLDSPLSDKYYQIEGNYLYCQNCDEVKIRYIADVKDVTKFDSEFCDCLALKLAEKICSPLTEDEQKTTMLKQLAQQKYIETSTKYGRDNRMIVINKPRYRQSKVFSEIQNFNYPAM
jgi:hypothetical protein